MNRGRNFPFLKMTQKYFKNYMAVNSQTQSKKSVNNFGIIPKYHVYCSRSFTPGFSTSHLRVTRHCPRFTDYPVVMFCEISSSSNNTETSVSEPVSSDHLSGGFVESEEECKKTPPLKKPYRGGNRGPHRGGNRDKRRRRLCPSGHRYESCFGHRKRSYTISTNNKWTKKNDTRYHDYEEPSNVETNLLRAVPQTIREVLERKFCKTNDDGSETSEVVVFNNVDFQIKMRESESNEGSNDYQTQHKKSKRRGKKHSPSSNWRRPKATRRRESPSHLKSRRKHSSNHLIQDQGLNSRYSNHLSPVPPHQISNTSGSVNTTHHFMPEDTTTDTAHFLGPHKTGADTKHPYPSQYQTDPNRDNCTPVGTTADTTHFHGPHKPGAHAIHPYPPQYQTDPNRDNGTPVGTTADTTHFHGPHKPGAHAIHPYPPQYQTDRNRDNGTPVGVPTGVPTDVTADTRYFHEPQKTGADTNHSYPPQYQTDLNRDNRTPLFTTKGTTHCHGPHKTDANTKLSPQYQNVPDGIHFYPPQYQNIPDTIHPYPPQYQTDPNRDCRAPVESTHFHGPDSTGADTKHSNPPQYQNVPDGIHFYPPQYQNIPNGIHSYPPQYQTDPNRDCRAPVGTITDTTQFHGPHTPGAHAIHHYPPQCQTNPGTTLSYPPQYQTVPNIIYKNCKTVGTSTSVNEPMNETEKSPGTDPNSKEKSKKKCPCCSCCCRKKPKCETDVCSFLEEGEKAVEETEKTTKTATSSKKESKKEKSKNEKKDKKKNKKKTTEEVPAEEVLSQYRWKIVDKDGMEKDIVVQNITPNVIEKPNDPIVFKNIREVAPKILEDQIIIKNKRAPFRLSQKLAPEKNNMLNKKSTHGGPSRLNKIKQSDIKHFHSTKNVEQKKSPKKRPSISDWIKRLESKLFRKAGISKSSVNNSNIRKDDNVEKKILDKTNKHTHVVSESQKHTKDSYSNSRERNSNQLLIVNSNRNVNQIEKSDKRILTVLDQMAEPPSDYSKRNENQIGMSDETFSIAFDQTETSSEKENDTSIRIDNGSMNALALSSKGSLYQNYHS